MPPAIKASFTFTNTGAPIRHVDSFQQSFANFLLGNVATFTQPSNDITPNLWAWQDEAWAQDDFKLNPRLTLYVGVRWSYFGQPADNNGQLTNFDRALYNAVERAQNRSRHGQHHRRQRDAAVHQRHHHRREELAVGLQDRAGPVSRTSLRASGVAWDPFGDGKTSVRAGYGVYYDSSLFGTYEQSIFQNPPFVASATLSNAPFSNVSAGTPPGTISTVYARATQLPNLIPYVQQWSLDIQRQLPKDVVLDVGYSGSKGTHLIGIVDLDQAPPGAALAAGLHAANGNTIFTSADESAHQRRSRPYLGYNAINAIQSAFDSNYHALLVSIEEGVWRGGLDRLRPTPIRRTSPTTAPTAPTLRRTATTGTRAEYGPATLDRQQVINFNYV